MSEGVRERERERESAEVSQTCNPPPPPPPHTAFLQPIHAGTRTVSFVIASSCCATASRCWYCAMTFAINSCCRASSAAAISLQGNNQWRSVHACVHACTT
jgi:hypothetical protein